MLKNSLLTAFFLSVQAVSVAIAFLGYHYLGLVNDYHDRNFIHLTATQNGIDSLAEYYVPTADALEEIRANVILARDQAVWCTDNLSAMEYQVLIWLGSGSAMQICERDTLRATETLEAVDAALKDARKGPLVGVPYMNFKEKVELVEEGLRDLKADSLEFYPTVNQISQLVRNIVSVCTLISGFLLAMLIGWAAWRIFQLLTVLAEQNQKLGQSQTRFNEALNAMNDGFALFDKDNKLLNWNSLYCELCSEDPEFLHVGISPEDILRRGLRDGFYPALSEQQIDEVLRDRDQQMANPDGHSVTIEIKGDRHIRNTFTRSSLGDMIALRTEITDLVREQRGQLEKTEQLALANEKITFKSLHDPLTELPNRRMLDNALSERMAEGPATVIRIDLDRFKQVNDVLGHAAGDFVLCKVAEILREELHADDLPSRIGGDEFVVLCQDGTSEKEANELACNLLQRITVPLTYEGRICRFGASFGIATSRDEDENSGELLSYADAALYAAKEAGRGTVEVFSPDLHRTYIEERRMGDELANALEDGQIVPFFHTQHDAHTKEIVGVEVLARWDHPRLGIQPPGTFLSVVCKLGMEGQLDAVIFDSAIKMAREFSAQGLHIPKLSFNVGASRLLDPALITAARRTLTPDDPNIAFEILESISLEDMDDSFRFAIEELRGLGFEVEIDDFGSGHASIASVMDIAPDTLKIDRRLIQPLGKKKTDADNQRAVQMVASILHLAQSMNIRVIAEGVETELQAKTLADLGCETLQGFLFSKPEPAASLAERLLEQNQAARFRA